MNFSFKNFLKILRPRPEIGGIEISDGEIKFLHLLDGKKIKNSIKISPGVIQEGRVVNKQEFEKNLKNLHSQINPRNKKIPVVVSISDENVYTQSIILPVLNNTNLEEAVRLNMEVVSPIDFYKSYSDWEKISMSQSSEFEVLASFVSKEILDPIYQALNQAGFIPLVIEQKAASVVRAIEEAEKTQEKPYFVLNINSDGISFSIVRGGFLYFNKFSSWSSVVGQNKLEREISFSDFSNLIVQETHKVINFYSSRFSDGIEDLYIISPGLESQVKSVIADNFSIKINLVEAGNLGIDGSWLVVMGSALRGSVSRSKDTKISLAPEGTEDLFVHSQILAFISLWRKILLSVFSVSILAAAGVYVFLNIFINSISNDLVNMSSGQNTAYFESLKKEAVSFNRNVDQALMAKSEQSRWDESISAIFEKAKPSVIIDRVFIQPSDLSGSVSARAPKESDAVAFKDKLATIPKLSKIDLPLSSFSPIDSNYLSFKINFYLSR